MFSNTPEIKYWLLIYCFAILPFLVYIITMTGDGTLQGALRIFALCILLLGPIFVTVEIDRFRGMGE